MKTGRKPTGRPAGYTKQDSERVAGRFFGYELPPYKVRAAALRKKRETAFFGRFGCFCCHGRTEISRWLP